MFYCMFLFFSGILNTLYSAFLVEMAHGLCGIGAVLDDIICVYELWGE